jgi:lipoprotein signal peptidase
VRRRIRLAVLVAVPVFAIDQASKLVAAAVHPDTYVLNSTSISIWWDLAAVTVAAAVLLVPFRPLAIAVGLWLGGAAGNLLDAHVWPGGVPDFIRVGGLRGTFNLADVFIAAGGAGLGTLLLVWVGVSASAARADARGREGSDAGAEVPERGQRRPGIVGGEGGPDLPAP